MQRQIAPQHNMSSGNAGFLGGLAEGISPYIDQWNEDRRKKALLEGQLNMNSNEEDQSTDETTGPEEQNEDGTPITTNGVPLTAGNVASTAIGVPALTDNKKWAQFKRSPMTDLITNTVKNSNTTIDPNYFLKTGFIESKFNPKAGSPTGAQGLFQFTSGTWKAIDGGKNDRHNPEANTRAAIKFAEDNQNYLKSKLGRTPTNAELYMAHNIGPGGATRLLHADPNALVTQSLIGSNPAHNPMFLMNNGHNITVRTAIARYRNQFGEN
jgi:soluble lytic murein transglycosylase-like protein